MGTTTTLYGERKQRLYRKLAGLQATLDKAEPGSLDFDFRTAILETVEQLPKREEQHWKTLYGPALKVAVGGPVPDMTLEVPVRMPAKLADLLASTCVRHGTDPDTAACEAIAQWCKEKQP
jgi:hypothetical protein